MLPGYPTGLIKSHGSLELLPDPAIFLKKAHLDYFPSVTIWKRKERVNWLVVLREALWAYIEYKRIPPNPRLGAMTIIPLTPPLKCNVNTMALHLKSGTKYMS